ncbi:MAG: head maturation protease, ClpP-related [Porcipelethomonas sp.]
MEKNVSYWNLAKNPRNEKEADLYIYSDIESDKEWIFGKISSDTSAESFRQKLSEMNDVEKINIYINSKGGDVFEGIGIYSQLKRHKAKKVVHIDALAASISSVIAMAGDEIVMSECANMMIHPVWAAVAGNAKTLREQADVLDKLTESVKNAYRSRCGEKLDEEKLDEFMSGETWLSAEECVKYGLADRLEGEQDKDPEPDNGGTPEPPKNHTISFSDKAIGIIGNFFM